MEDFRYQKLTDHLIKEYLRGGKTIALGISGKSMRPLIRQGDSILIEKCAPRSFSIGDIITFKKDGKYFTHRLLWTTKRGNDIRLVTRGDNEINTDPPVLPVSVLGKVASIQRGHRTLCLNTAFWRFINRFLGMIFLMETIFILFYQFAASKFMPSRAFVHATFKPSHLYRRLRKRGLNFATRIIM
jgi:signal peptidase I